MGAFWSAMEKSPPKSPGWSRYTEPLLKTSIRFEMACEAQLSWPEVFFFFEKGRRVKWVFIRCWLVN